MSSLVSLAASVTDRFREAVILGRCFVVCLGCFGRCVGTVFFDVELQRLLVWSFLGCFHVRLSLRCRVHYMTDHGVLPDGSLGLDVGGC